jgi:hypothetical protein
MGEVFPIAIAPELAKGCITPPVCVTCVSLSRVCHAAALLVLSGEREGAACVCWGGG